MMREARKFLSPAMLSEIRERADWRRVFEALWLEQAKGSKPDDWWASSPFSEDIHPSFHMSDKGWYCHSTGQGGGVIELVQKVMETRGRAMNCFEAGRWLMENGLSTVEEEGWKGKGEATGEGGKHKPTNPGKQEEPAAMSGEKGKSGTGGREGNGPYLGPGGGPETETEAGPGSGTGSTEGSKPDDYPEPEERAGKEVSERRENRPIRQTLTPLLEKEHEELKRRGIGRETCDYLGCGYLPPGHSKSPLRGRIVFQVRGVREEREGELRPVILTHVGRAVTAEEAEEWGKWRAYEGFLKSLELYNIDHALLDAAAALQARETGHVIVAEGCFDVAKLVEAEIGNAVATFGSHLSAEQLRRLDLIADRLGVRRFLFCYDRDRAGRDGAAKALELIGKERAGRYTAEAFDWEMAFPSPARGEVKIPEAIGDLCEFRVEQLEWLRAKKVI
jgi:hypothetical protein